MGQQTIDRFFARTNGPERGSRESRKRQAKAAKSVQADDRYKKTKVESAQGTHVYVSKESDLLSSDSEDICEIESNIGMGAEEQKIKVNSLIKQEQTDFSDWGPIIDVESEEVELNYQDVRAPGRIIDKTEPLRAEYDDSEVRVLPKIEHIVEVESDEDLDEIQSTNGHLIDATQSTSTYSNENYKEIPIQEAQSAILSECNQGEDFDTDKVSNVISQELQQESMLQTETVQMYRIDHRDTTIGLVTVPHDTFIPVKVIQPRTTKFSEDLKTVSYISYLENTEEGPDGGTTDEEFADYLESLIHKYELNNNPDNLFFHFTLPQMIGIVLKGEPYGLYHHEILKKITERFSYLVDLRHIDQDLIIKSLTARIFRDRLSVGRFRNIITRVRLTEGTEAEYPDFKYNKAFSPLVNSILLLKKQQQLLRKGLRKVNLSIHTVEEQKLLHLVLFDKYYYKFDQGRVGPGEIFSMTISHIIEAPDDLKRKLRICKILAESKYPLSHYQVNPAIVVYYLLSDVAEMYGNVSRLEHLSEYKVARDTRNIVKQHNAWREEIHKLKSKNPEYEKIINGLDSYGLLERGQNLLPEEFLLGEPEVDSILLAAAIDLIGSGGGKVTLACSSNLLLLEQFSRLLRKKGLVPAHESTVSIRFRVTEDIQKFMKSGLKENITVAGFSIGLTSEFTITPV